MASSSTTDSPSYQDPPNSYALQDHGQGPPRKKMRKGTKSCLQCRRRKIKCTFEQGRPQVCNECYARGSTCIDQEHGDINTYAQNTQADQVSYSLRERVTQLEDLVRRVLHKLPEKEDACDSFPPPTQRTAVDTQAAEVLKSLKSSLAADVVEESIMLPGGLREDAPALTLFDNAVIARRDDAPQLSRSQYNKSKSLVSALTRLLPSPHDLDIILDASARWFVIWKQMFPQISDIRCETVKESVSHSLRSERPAEVAKTMLCIAISVHQMDPDFDWSRLQLRDHPKDLMEKYITVIDQLITTDDEIAATVDGVECMVLEAKYHMNMGRPRRAWLLFHRAIAFAQLLGLHRLSNRRPRDNDTGYQRQISLWCHLFIGDRFLSLMLGLPYSVSEAFCAPYIPPPGVVLPDVSEGEHYVARICPIITKIVDRNQSPTPIPYSATLRIDQELEEMKDRTDPAWWTVKRIPGSSTQQHFDRLQSQFTHHQTRSLLHMPFMLKSSTDKRFQYSHQAALESSRETIRYYNALRMENDVGPYVCKLVDFQAFTAAMLLLLNLCGYAHHTRGLAPKQPDLDQDQLDSELIDNTIANLREASKEAGGIVAAQSAKALELMAHVRHGCADEDLLKRLAENPTCQVSIPYFGTISIGIGTHFVPIQRGTYPSRNEPRRSSSNSNTHPPTTGLPTPPSLTSNSTQPSPVTGTLDAHSQHYSPRSASRAAFNGTKEIYGAATDYVAPGLGSTTYSTSNFTSADLDPFVTFDSYMPLPPTEMGAGSSLDGVDHFGFPLVDSQSGAGSSSGATPGQGQGFQGILSGSHPAGGHAGENMGTGFSFGPGSTGIAGGAGMCNFDLDQAWNWTGELGW